jgi:hypothetical protein
MLLIVILLPAQWGCPRDNIRGRIRRKLRRGRRPVLYVDSAQLPTTPAADIYRSQAWQRPSMAAAFVCADSNRKIFHRNDLVTDICAMLLELSCKCVRS